MNNKLKTALPQLLFWILTLLIISLLFLILNPKLSTILNSQKQAQEKADFLSSVIHSRSISDKEYWQFREFYSPGSFQFDKNGIKRSDLDKTLVSMLPLEDTTAYLFFTSEKLSSIDNLTENSNLEEIGIPVTKDKEILYQDDFLIISEDDQSTYIMFLKPYQNFKNTSGFFEHWGGVTFDEEGLYWLNITKLKK